LPCDSEAQKFLSFIENGQLPEYNRKYREYTDPLWQNEYLKNEKV